MLKSSIEINKKLKQVAAGWKQLVSNLNSRPHYAKKKTKKTKKKPIQEELL